MLCDGVKKSRKESAGEAEGSQERPRHCQEPGYTVWVRISLCVCDPLGVFPLDCTTVFFKNGENDTEIK